MLNLFKKRGGLLKALDLWDWYDLLPLDRKRAFKHYYVIKCTNDLSFPYGISHLESGNIKTLYTKRTFLGTVAQTSMLEGDLYTAEWIYKEAIEMEGSFYEEHLLLNDLVLLYQRLKDLSKMEEFSRRDVELFEKYKKELFGKTESGFMQVNSFNIYIYVLEKKGEKGRALKVLEYALSEGISIPFADDIKRRLSES